jgi:hypothetical protein
MARRAWNKLAGLGGSSGCTTGSRRIRNSAAARMPGVPCNPPIVLALRGDWVTPPAGMARQSSSEAAAPPAALTPEQSGLLRLVYGAQAAQIIYVAAKLGVPDILKDGPRTSASACGRQARRRAIT